MLVLGAGGRRERERFSLTLRLRGSLILQCQLPQWPLACPSSVLVTRSPQALEQAVSSAPPFFPSYAPKPWLPKPSRGHLITQPTVVFPAKGLLTCFSLAGEGGVVPSLSYRGLACCRRDEGAGPATATIPPLKDTQNHLGNS